MDNSIFYDIGELLTHNRLFSMVVGSRGKGKTHSSLTKAIKRFKEGKGEFIYLRRYKEEIKPLKKESKLFDDIRNEFPNDKLDVKGEVCYINDVKCGYILALSVCAGKKSIAFPDVRMIIFDEFIIDTKKSTYRYLGEEVKRFLEFFNTVNRLRNDCIAVFLSNNISSNNPYFVYFKINPNTSNKRFIHVGKEIVIEYIPADEDFKQAVYNTRFGQLIKGTPYADYAVENKSMHDNFDFIEKKQGTAHYYCTLRYNKVDFGVWVDMNKGKFYISKDIDTYYGHTYCLTLDDHTPNTLLLSKKNGILKSLSDNFKLGNVFYESLKIKNESFDALRILL